MELLAFNEIPPGIRKPGSYLEFNVSRASRGLPANDHRILMIAQGSSAKTVDPLTIVNVYDREQAATLFGRGSLAHRMARAALAAYPYINLQFILLDDSDVETWPDAATHQITLNQQVIGEVSQDITAGYLDVWIAGDLVRIDVTADDTLADLADSLTAAINADLNLPVTAEVSVEEVNIVTLTSKTLGIVGGEIPIRAGGKTTNVVAVPASVSSGTSHPNANEINAALTVAFAAGHTLISCPYLDVNVMLALRAHINTVSNGVEKRGCRAVTAFTVEADARDSAEALNNWRICHPLLPGAYNWHAEITAAFTAVVASEADPARPLNGLPLAGIKAPDVADWLGRNAQESLLHAGITPLEVGLDKTTVQIVRAISTYTKTPEGIDDPYLLDFTKAGSADYVRVACRAAYDVQFKRVKKTDSVKRKIRSVLLKTLLDLEKLEIVENVEANKDLLILVNNPSDNTRVDARIPADIVDGLHILAAQIDLL